tara:strand:- start:376 stop:882 length:507 start_codon:yes stop_codon:yes gene_type:complete
MSKVETDVFYFKDDVGKNLYRKKTYYTLVVEQDVLAKDKDEADTKFSDHGGINHSKIGKDITDANEGVETYMVDANYVESDDTKFIGKVKYDTDTYNQTLDEAIEAEDIHIDTWADEDEPHQLTKIKLVEPKMTVAEAVEVGQKLKKEKEESDVDVALNLEAERELGK